MNVVSMILRACRHPVRIIGNADVKRMITGYSDTEHDAAREYDHGQDDEDKHDDPSRLPGDD